MIALGVILLVLCLLFLMVILIRQPHQKPRKSINKPKENNNGKA